MMPIMMDEKRATTVMGFEVGPFIKQIKKELGIITPVLLNFEGDVTKAHVDWKTGKCAIGLPTVGAIQKGLNLDPVSVVAKQKAGLIEELCHCFHKEVTHNDKVVGCTVQKINEHLTQEERATPYIIEKIEFLERSRELIESVPL